MHNLVWSSVIYTHVTWVSWCLCERPIHSLAESLVTMSNFVDPTYIPIMKMRWIDAFDTVVRKEWAGWVVAQCHPSDWLAWVHV